MPVLTDLAQAEVKRDTRVLYGVTQSRVLPLVTDGINTMYVCDVTITPYDSTGMINQYFDEKNKKDGKPRAGLITGIPGQAPEDWQWDDSLPGRVDTSLRNVPIARNAPDLLYAEVGSPVKLTRTKTGQWEITGLSIDRAGTHLLYPVNLGDMTLGPVIDMSVEHRLLNLAEFGELPPGGFGSLALGAIAIYQGGELIRIV